MEWSVLALCVSLPEFCVVLITPVLSLSHTHAAAPSSLPMPLCCGARPFVIIPWMKYIMLAFFSPWRTWLCSNCIWHSCRRPIAVDPHFRNKRNRNINEIDLDNGWWAATIYDNIYIDMHILRQWAHVYCIPAVVHKILTIRCDVECVCASHMPMKYNAREKNN